MAATLDEVADLLREVLESMETLEAAARSIIEGARDAKSGAVGGRIAADAPSGSGAGGGRGTGDKKGGAGSFGGAFARQSGSQALQDFTAPNTTSGTAFTNLGLGASNALLGAGITGALLNVSGVGQGIAANQSAEQSTRDIASRVAGAGGELTSAQIQSIFQGNLEASQRDQKIQEQVSGVIGSQQTNALVEALEKVVDKAIPKLSQAISTAFDFYRNKIFGGP